MSLREEKEAENAECVPATATGERGQVRRDATYAAMLTRACALCVSCLLALG